ncbi:GNAT family N-acetyltransferase [Streptomyces prasinus]|uniref:GNAT family N-acetyltransferase n=1 Tax=Streptomyces prasinus TaxID=67345 RepID=UPI0033A2B0AD
MSLPPAPWPGPLTTERLLLRPVEAADVPAHTRLWTDPEVRRHLGGPVAPEVVRARARGCVGLPGLFSLVRRQDGTVVGSVLVEAGARDDGRPEVSYQLLPEHWGRGFAREALRAVTDLLPDGAVAVTQEANARSRRLLEALGATVAERFSAWGESQVRYRFGDGSRAPAGDGPCEITCRSFHDSCCKAFNGDTVTPTLRRDS